MHQTISFTNPKRDRPLHASSSRVVFHFCKTNGYAYELLVKTILMYLLSEGKITHYSHDGERADLAFDVDFKMFKALKAGSKYTVQRGLDLLKACPDSDDSDEEDYENGHDSVGAILCTMASLHQPTTQACHPSLPPKPAIQP